MKFFRIVLGTTPEGRREGDERDTEGLSCGSAPSEATAGATRSSRSAWSFCIVPVSGEGKGVRPLFPTGLGCWGPSKGACSWAGWLPSCRAIPRRSCICEQTAATTPAVGNTRASVLKEQSGDGTSIYSTIQNSAKCGGGYIFIN